MNEGRIYGWNECRKEERKEGMRKGWQTGRGRRGREDGKREMEKTSK